MADTTLPGLLGVGDHASRPAAADVGSGGLYSCTDHDLVYQTDGSSWATWATLGSAASGAITASGYTQATARLLGRTTASTGAIEEITVGSGLSMAAGTITATGGFPTTAHAECTADVTLSTPNTITDSTGTAVSLTAGTWIIDAQLVFQSNGTGGYCYAEIREGTNKMSGARGFLTTGQYATLPLHAVVMPGSTLTYKVSGQTSDASDKIVRYGNGTVIATMITAIKVA